LEVPAFYNPNRNDSIFPIPLRISQATDFRAKHNIKPSVEDTVKVALLGIDIQNTFCLPGWELYVDGAQDDIDRLLRWGYSNLDHITKIFLTRDKHFPIHIAHPFYWKDKDGNHPEPFTTITEQDVLSFKWQVNKDIAHLVFPGENSVSKMVCHAVDYTRWLRETGKYVLTIWPEHAGAADASSAIVSSLVEFANFHTYARSAQYTVWEKGEKPNREHYSPFQTEVGLTRGDDEGEFRIDLIDELLDYDAIITLGQAETHCVKAAEESILNRIIETDPAKADRLYLVLDGTSKVPDIPVPGGDFANQVEKHYEWCVNAGAHLVKMVDDNNEVIPIEEWGLVTV
jgi:nicotinamidase-related amidase